MDLLADRYELEAAAGAGGGGSVYLARDTKLPGRRCAVKLITVPHGPQGNPVREQVLAEAAILARLDHPGLPKVSDIVEAGDQVGIVMDFVPGDDLLQVVQDARRRGRPLDVVHVLRWADSLCDVLSYLHGQQPPVIHRDIKPANVRLMPDGGLKLVDFGLAEAYASADGGTVTVSRLGGTAAYQAIEQASAASPQNARTDLYGLGATLYHLLAGHAPLSAHERFLTPTAWRPLAGERTDLSPGLVAAVEEAMALKPEDRPADVESFRRLLHRPLADEGSAEGPGPWRLALGQRRRLVIGVAVLWIAAVVATLLGR